MTNFKVGEVKHYYDKLAVAMVEIETQLSVGEIIRFVRGGEDLFDQKVSSIQFGHEKKSFAGKGNIVGLKVDREVKAGTEIYKVI